MKKSVLILLLFLFLVGCESETTQSTNPEASHLVATTVGDMVYIPINADGSLDENMGLLMAAIGNWQAENPCLRIVDFEYVYQQLAYATPAYVFGVSLLTEPQSC